MTDFRLHKSFIRAGAVFKVPILSWTTDVSSRFFQAVYGALDEMLYIKPGDFVAPSGVSLGDCSVALRIFGGNSTLTLNATGVIADFPSIDSAGIEFANSVIFQGYQALRTEFSELEIKSIESNAGHHLEIIGDGEAQKVLAGGSQNKLQKRADNLRDAVVEPGMRFRVVSKNGKWNSNVTVEKSHVVTNGVYLVREIIVSDLSECETTQQQFDLIERIEHIVLDLVGLKPEAQGNDTN